MPAGEKTPEEVYDEFWKDILEPGGQFNMEQTKKELHDYWIALQEVPKVYSELAGLSKITTHSHYIINGAQEQFNRNAALDMLDKMLDEASTGAEKQRIIDYANDLSNGAYEEYLRHQVVKREVEF